MSLEEIINFRRVDDRVLTAGQPTEEQLADIAAAGVEAVVNLATCLPMEGPLPDEQDSLVTLGMSYHHIPVVWESPTAENYTEFSKLMDGLADKKVMVHCAYNARVTAFYSLYGMEKLGWSVEQADDFIVATWDPAEHPPWADFIAERRAEIAGTS